MQVTHNIVASVGIVNYHYAALRRKSGLEILQPEAHQPVAVLDNDVTFGLRKIAKELGGGHASQSQSAVSRGATGTLWLLNLAANSSIKTVAAPMPDQPPSDRFKAEMPQIPGVPARGAQPEPSTGSSLRLAIGLLAVLLVIFLGARWALRPRRADSKATGRQPQIELPTPAPDPSTLVPHATSDAPGIADTAEMAKPWSAKEFFVKNGLTGENIPGILVRLPTGSASQATGYWAFSVNAPFGNCKLEYVTDLTRLRAEYGFARASHPMVGNPCNHTVFDPAKTASLPGTGAMVRGAIVQGADLRPPLGIEIQVRGKDILAIRAE